MQRYLLILASVLVVPMVQGFKSNGEYATFAKCNPTIMSSIQTFWKTSGAPTNNLKKIEESGRLIVLHTSYTHLNEDNKCIFIKVTGNTMNVTFVPKNGGPAASMIWEAEQGDDGVIRGHRRANETPEITWNWYTISFNNGVHVCYICSDDEGSHEPSLGNVMLAEGSTSNVLSTTAISTFSNLLKGWGFDFKYNYGSECFSNESSSPTATAPLGGLLGKPSKTGLGGIF